MYWNKNPFRSFPRPLWMILVALLLIGAASLRFFTPANPPAYRPADVAADKPILAVQGLPGGIHYPASAGTGALPRLDIPSAYFDFGRIDSDRVVEHTFVIRNRGTANLLIHRAYTTCECTRAQFSASVIPPGKVALVTVQYDPRVHSAPGSTLRRGVIIESNDPENTQSELWIQVRIR